MEPRTLLDTDILSGLMRKKSRGIESGESLSGRSSAVDDFLGYAFRDSSRFESQARNCTTRGV